VSEKKKDLLGAIIDFLTSFSDSLAFNHVYPLLEKLHKIPDDAKIEWDKEISGLKCNVIITWENGAKSIILEFGRKNLVRTIKRLIERRKVALWAYAIVELPVHVIVSILLNPKLNLGAKVHEMGIGIISTYEAEPMLVVRSTCV